VPRKDDTTATFSLRLERAKWAEIFFRLMDGILDMGLAVYTRMSQTPPYPGCQHTIWVSGWLAAASL
jgi:hypothetical protein